MKLTFPLFFLGISLCASGPAKAASEYRETFSAANDTSGWYEVSTGTASSLAQDPVSGTLAFSATGYGLFFTSADALSSGGAFVGDYTAAGITWFTFDLNLAPSSAVSGLVLQLTNFTEDETWEYALTLPAPGVTTPYTIPLDAGGAGWTQVTGGESFGFLLSQTEEISLAFSSGAPGNLSGFIDNVATVPEPSAMLLTGMGLLFAVRPRRRV